MHKRYVLYDLLRKPRFSVIGVADFFRGVGVAIG